LYIVIVGCGSVGSELATGLSAEGHNVVVVDSDPAAFERLGSAFDGITVLGDGTDTSILLDAGSDQADVIAAVTSDDNVNITVAQVASSVLGVPKVVARVFEPQREAVFKELGLATVCPTLAGVSEIRTFLLAGTLNKRLGLGAGEVAVYDLSVREALAGKAVESIEIPGKLRIVAVTHDGTATIPVPGALLQQGDLLTIAVRVDAASLLRSLAGEGDDER
jgi:trk system potassium uptake protein TrkA